MEPKTESNDYRERQANTLLMKVRGRGLERTTLSIQANCFLNRKNGSGHISREYS